MKGALSVAITLLACFGAGISAIWAVVEFILYLVKDKPFNWTSVWVFGICVVLGIIGAISAAVIQARERKSLRNGSTFLKRMEELRNQKNRI